MTLLKNRLEERGVRLKGNVIDIGIRDGRNLSLIKELGAEDIYGCDPENKEFAEALATRLILPERLIHATVEDVSTNFRYFFDCALICQISPPLLSDDGSFFRAVFDILKPDGMLIYTVSENNLAKRFEAKFTSVGFKTQESLKLDLGVCRCNDVFFHESGCENRKRLHDNYVDANQNIFIARKV